MESFKTGNMLLFTSVPTALVPALIGCQGPNVHLEISRNVLRCTKDLEILQGIMYSVFREKAGSALDDTGFGSTSPAERVHEVAGFALRPVLLHAIDFLPSAHCSPWMLPQCFGRNP